MDRIAACIASHPTWDDRRIAKSVRGATVSAIRAARDTSATATARNVPPSRGRSLNQFRAQYDIRQRIREGLSKHLKSCYMTDQEFREACGIGTTEWRKHADDSVFDRNRLRHRGQVFWAQPTMIDRMAEIAGVIRE